MARLSGLAKMPQSQYPEGKMEMWGMDYSPAGWSHRWLNSDTQRAFIEEWIDISYDMARSSPVFHHKALEAL